MPGATSASMESILNRIESLDRPAALQWNKLGKAFQLQKLFEYADRLSDEKGLPEEQRTKLKDALKERLDRKRLQKADDVAYDSKQGTVTRIDCLVCHADGTFGFRNANSVSPLATLAPKTRRLRVDVGRVALNAPVVAVPHGAGTAAVLAGAEGRDDA
jgi:hypothetical protein